jgi:hypothetical protein
MKRAVTAFTALLALSAGATAAAAADGLSWTYRADQARLYYAVANSDDIAATLECQARSGQVRVAEYGSAPDAAKRSGAVTLASGGQTATLKATRSSDPLLDEVVEADVSAASPVLKQFQRTGEVIVSRDGMRHRLAASTAGERKDIARFFAACGKGAA